MKKIIDLVLVLAILFLIAFIVKMFIGGHPANPQEPVDTVEKVQKVAQEEPIRDKQARWRKAVLDGTIIEDDAVRTELAIGVDLDEVVDKAGDTPMHIACMECCLPLLHFLTDSGAELNLKNKSGETPLDTAILNNSIYAVEYLIPHKAITAAIAIDEKGRIFYKSARLNGVDPSIQNLLRVCNSPNSTNDPPLASQSQ